MQRDPAHARTARSGIANPRLHPEVPERSAGLEGAVPPAAYCREPFGAAVATLRRRRMRAGAGMGPGRSAASGRVHPRP
jgi:hypothetical protein